MAVFDYVLSMAKENGYKVLKPNKADSKSAFLITPSGNILSVYDEYFGGCNLSLRYVPSKKSGTGCSAYNPYECPVIWTMSMIAEKEQELLKWAKRMKVEFYASPEAFIEWYEGFYNTKLEEVA